MSSNPLTPSGQPTGSLKLSTADTSFFSNESKSDLLITASTPGQDILLGQVPGSNAAVQITSNLVNVLHTINCGELVQSYGLNLYLGDMALFQDVARLSCAGGESAWMSNAVAFGSNASAFSSNATQGILNMISGKPYTRGAPLGSVTLTSGQVATYSLPSRFTDMFTQGSGLSYSLATNPQNNAGIDGSGTLSVTDQSTGATYGVTVVATNASGSASDTLTVTDSPADLPTVSWMTASSTQYGTYVTTLEAMYTPAGATLRYYATKSGGAGTMTSYLDPGGTIVFPTTAETATTSSSFVYDAGVSGQAATITLRAFAELGGARSEEASIVLTIYDLPTIAWNTVADTYYGSFSITLDSSASPDAVPYYYAVLGGGVGSLGEFPTTAEAATTNAVLTYTAGTSDSEAITITVYAFSRVGTAQSQDTPSFGLTVFDVAAPTVVAPLGAVFLAAGQVAYQLSDFFGGIGLSYSVTSDPQNNATISSGILLVTDQSTGATYGVTVVATNAAGSASDTLTVTDHLVPSISGSIGSFTMTSYGQVSTFELRAIYTINNGVTLYFQINTENWSSVSYNSASGFLTVTDPGEWGNQIGIYVFVANDESVYLYDTLDVFGYVSSVLGRIGTFEMTSHQQVATFDLASIYSTDAGDVLSFSINANPFNNATLDPATWTLSVVDRGMGQIYSVGVQSTGVNDPTISLNDVLIVTDFSLPFTVSGAIPTPYQFTTLHASHTWDLNSIYSTSDARPIVVTSVGLPPGMENAYVDANNVLTVVDVGNGTQYYVTLVINGIYTNRLLVYDSLFAW